MQREQRKNNKKKGETRKLWLLPLPIVIGIAVVVFGGVGIIGALNGWFGGGGSIPSDTFTRGLVGYWSFDEGTGTTAYDASGNSNDGTLTWMSTNTEAWTIGKIGGALTLDGADDYVSVSDNNSLDITGNISAEVWFNTYGSLEQMIIWKGTNYYLRIDPSINEFLLRHNGAGDGSTAVTATLNTNTWYHFVGTYDGANTAIYVNGVYIDGEAATGSLTTNANALQIGPGGNTYFNGIIDEVKIYSRALSAEEIRYHYNRGGPVSHWKFDEGSGSTAYDSTENNNDGTLSGPSWVTGKQGSALSFDGTNDYINGGTTLLNSSTDGTVGMWIKPFTDGETDTTKLYWNTTILNKGLVHMAIQQMSTNKIRIYSYDNGPPTVTHVLDSNNSVTINQWNYISYTWDSAGSTIYINGVHDNVSTKLTWSNPHPGHFNQELDLGGYTIEALPYYFNGLIDDVRIYNYVRTPDEIRLDYNAGFAARFGPLSTCDRDPGACMTQGLVGYWNFEEGLGTITYDQSDQSNNGTIVSAPPWEGGIIPLSGGKEGGTALDFDGSADYVNFGNPASLQIIDELTIEYWVKLNSTQASAQFCNPIGKDHSSTEGVTLQIDHTDTVAPYSQYWYMGHGTSLYNLNYANTNLRDDTWHHLVVTKSRTYGMASYLDGELIASNNTYTKAIVYDTSDWNFGREATLATRICTMVGDELRIYSRVLSAEEVRYHYNRGGPVAHWKMDEGSGQTVYDATENNNDGTIPGSAEMATSTIHGWTTGKYGSALSFDGVDDYVDTGSLIQNSDWTYLTAEVWIKPNMTSSGTIFENAYSSEGFSLSLLSGVTPRFVFGDDSIVEDMRSKRTITSDNWHHIVAVFDGDTQVAKIYINGVGESFSTSLTSITKPDGYTFFIGAENTSGGSNFNGLIDDVRIYNHVRTPEQIRVDYNAGLAAHFGPKTDCDSDPGACITEGLIGYWDFEEGSGAVLYDQSGNSNNGAITGALWTGGIIPLSGGKEGGGALQFDGSDDRVVVGDIGTLTEFTVNVWVKWFNPSDYENVFHLKYAFQQQKTNLTTRDADTVEWYGPDGDGPAIGAGTLKNNEWVMMTVASDASAQHVWLDGRFIASGGSGTTTPFTTNLYIATGYDLSVLRSINGIIDELRVYNRVLSSEEVRYHYNRGGPVAHWKMDEGSGSTAYDRTPNDNDGTLYGEMATSTTHGWSIGKYGSALLFDGVDDYMDCGTDSSFDAMTEFTTSMWINPSVIDGVQRQILFEFYKTNTDRLNIRIDKGVFFNLGELMFYNDISDADSPVGSDFILQAGQWYYTTLTIDSLGVWRIYINGDLKKTSNEGETIADLADGFQVTIGGNFWDSVFQDSSNGLIDDVRIYNYARTPEQIRVDYNAGLSTYFK